MSKQDKKYLTSQNSKDFIVRQEFQKALTKEQFIEDFLNGTEILVEEIQEGQVIQSLKISDLVLPEVRGLWKVNLEKEIAGVSTKNYFKTPEIALLILTEESEDNYHLHIVLIELKSSLKDDKLKKSSNPKTKPKYEPSTLTTCEEKFKNAVNRLYLLLSLNDIKNHKIFQHYKSISIEFKGLIFYKNNKVKKDDDTELYQILTKILSQTKISQNDRTFIFPSILDAQEKMIIDFRTQEKITLQALINI